MIVEKGILDNKYWSNAQEGVALHSILQVTSLYTLDFKKWSDTPLYTTSCRSGVLLCTSHLQNWSGTPLHTPDNDIGTMLRTNPLHFPASLR